MKYICIYINRNGYIRIIPIAVLKEESNVKILLLVYSFLLLETYFKIDFWVQRT